MLDVKKLSVLRKVAAEGSLSRAAEALSYTPSAVSQQIAQLERETGAKLIERGPRGVHLTDAGRALVAHADAIVARLASAEAELEAIAQLRSGRLRLASFPTAAATLVPEAISVFRRRHPDVAISLTEAEPDASVPRLRGGELELAVIFECELVPRPEWEGLERVELVDDPMYVALPENHPLADRPGLVLRDLTDEVWIGGVGPTLCPQVLVRACHKAGFVPNIALESNEYEAVQALVAAEVGVALVPGLALLSSKEGVVVRSLGGETPVRHIRAAVVADGFRSPSATAMLSILQEIGRRYQPKLTPPSDPAQHQVRAGEGDRTQRLHEPQAASVEQGSTVHGAPTTA